MLGEADMERKGTYIDQITSLSFLKVAAYLKKKFEARNC